MFAYRPGRRARSRRAAETEYLTEATDDRFVADIAAEVISLAGWIAS
jgi:hypothetical protein